MVLQHDPHRAEEFLRDSGGDHAYRAGILASELGADYTVGGREELARQLMGEIYGGEPAGDKPRIIRDLEQWIQEETGIRTRGLPQDQLEHELSMRSGRIITDTIRDLDQGGTPVERRARLAALCYGSTTVLGAGVAEDVLDHALRAAR